MKFELNGKEYEAVERTRTFVELYVKSEDGKYRLIPFTYEFSRIEEIAYYMEKKGAKVVKE